MRTKASQHSSARHVTNTNFRRDQSAKLRRLLNAKSHLRHQLGSSQGFVMTDWGTTGSMSILSDPNAPKHKYGDSFASGCVKAGNDLTMPGGQGDVDDILGALDKKEGEVPYPLTLGELQRCAKRILNVILQMERE